jgi:hypothetical protein
MVVHMGFAAKMMWGLLFGSIGSGYFVYGRKQSNLIALLAGLALCVFPYFVSSGWLMLVIGFVLVGVPFFLRH